MAATVPEADTVARAIDQPPIISHPSALTAARHGRTPASQDRPSSQAPKSRRVWIYEEPETYFTVHPLLARDDVVLAFDSLDTLSWNNAVASARRTFGGVRGEVVVVADRIPPGFIGRVMTLQNYGVATVTFEPDPFALVKRELTERPRDPKILWLGDPGEQAMAAHAARLRSTAGQLVLAVSDPKRLDWLLSTGRVTGVYSVGTAIPASIAGRRHIPHLGRLDRLGDLVAFGLSSGGDGASPPAAPLPDGTRFTLAVWSGVPGYADYSATSPQERPLSFYSSQTPAAELCRGHADCIVANLWSYICPYAPDCSNVFEPAPGKGWVGNPEPTADAGIADIVNTFNDDPANIAKRWEITNLAIVSHPLDLPYRRFLMPYTFCCSGSPCVPDCGMMPAEVDCLSTDNTEPRDGDCLDTVDGTGAFDRATGSTDFEFANIADDTGLPPTADLAFGRIMGQDISGAMRHVCTIRSVLLGTAPVPRGAAVISGHSTQTARYDLVTSLFDEFYGVATKEPCKPKFLGSPPCRYPTLPCRDSSQDPYCPTNDHTDDQMTYDLVIDWLRHLSPADGNAELGDIRTHQDNVPEPITSRYPPDHHLIIECPQPRPPGPCSPNLNGVPGSTVRRLRSGGHTHGPDENPVHQEARQIGQ